MPREGLFLRNVALKSLRDQRRALVGFSIGIVIYVGFLAAFFPTVRDQAAKFDQILDAYPPALKTAFGIDSLTTGAGYLHAELFSAMLPILFLVYAIGRGSDLIAGEEERGQLELVLATPLTRRAAALQKALALGAGLLVLGLVLFATLLVADLAVGLDLSLVRLAAEVASLVLLAAACGALALAAGALRGRRGLAIAVATAVAAGAYVLDLVSKLVEGARPLRWASLFSYYDGSPAILHGPDWAGLAVLAGVAVALVGVAVAAFDRRDLGRA